MNTIYEMAVYDGAMKVWRVLNLLTGSIYCVEYATEELANLSIEDGKTRSGMIVRKTNLLEVRSLLAKG